MKVTRQLDKGDKQSSYTHPKIMHGPGKTVKANPDTVAFTADRAKKGPPNRKKEARRQRRIDDYLKSKASPSREVGVSKRWESGGFHAPGSMQ